MKLTIDGTEYEYEVRYINGWAVAIGYRADLRGADLTNANLIGANFTNANLTAAKLRGAIWIFAYGLSSVKGKPASLPEGWTYTKGKGIHKEEL